MGWDGEGDWGEKGGELEGGLVVRGGGGLGW